jgi:hypothetical protein
MPVTKPLHIDCEDGVAVTVGLDPTLIITSKGIPGQDPELGVTVYVAVPEVPGLEVYV